MKAFPICLVSGSHLSANPRLVKEADTLHRAGYPVHVVAGRSFPPNDPHDRLILSRAGWTCTIVNYAPGANALRGKLARAFCRRLVAAFPTAPWWVAARAQHPAAGSLADAARRVPAALYIGHTLPGLVAAATAAAHNRARLAFDAEDFHSQETRGAMEETAERHAIRRLEQTLLPLCCHVSAASPLIAEAYAETYGIPPPLVVQNALPLEQAPATGVAIRAPGSPARFYWFSQTVGPERGLEGFLSVLGRMRTKAVLNLRGTVTPEYSRELADKAQAAGFDGGLNFLPHAPASEMARLAADNDVGLALELTHPPNRDLCLTNKLYTYLLAGIPLLYTPTRAQSAFAFSLGRAALPIDLADPAATALRIDSWLTDPDSYTAARRAAWDLGQSRFNWEAETPALLAAIAQIAREAMLRT